MQNFAPPFRVIPVSHVYVKVIEIRVFWNTKERIRGQCEFEKRDFWNNFVFLFNIILISILQIHPRAKN